MLQKNNLSEYNHLRRHASKISYCLIYYRADKFKKCIINNSSEKETIDKIVERQRLKEARNSKRF